MVEIPLTQNKFALIDNEDFPLISLFKWCAHKNNSGNTFYATTSLRVNKKRILLRMHRLILNVKPREVSDHRDGNGLNNKKSNLRKCTQSQNCMNRRKLKNASSKYKGIYWQKQIKRWYAQLCYQGKRIHCGCFKNEIDAAKAYDKVAKKIHGEFARLNFS